ncbi:ABC transporter ATP-binding protein [Planctomycetota bacterium]
MIVLERIEKTYGDGEVSTPVLRGVTFRIEPGEYVAIMGSSGTGKSTLMNILGCLDKPTAGEYRLGDTDVVRLDDDALSRIRNRKIGFVFQQFHLLERTTALRNVMLPLIYADFYPEDARERAEKVLVAVGLEERMGYKPGELSGGQQQRVAIARALITDPEIVLADEPTGNLDKRSGLEVLSIFKRLHREGNTIIAVTHDEAVAQHADRIVLLEDGQVSNDQRVAEPRLAEEELLAMRDQEEAR